MQFLDLNAVTTLLATISADRFYALLFLVMFCCVCWTVRGIFKDRNSRRAEGVQAPPAATDTPGKPAPYEAPQIYHR